SPCDHWRMSSAVARPMRSSSKKLTSSTCSLPQKTCRWLVPGASGGSGGPAAGAVHPSSHSDLLDAAWFSPGQVDAQFLGGAEDVFFAITHLDGHAVTGEHLDIEAERL